MCVRIVSLFCDIACVDYITCESSQGEHKAFNIPKTTPWELLVIISSYDFSPIEFLFFILESPL